MNRPALFAVLLMIAFQLLGAQDMPADIENAFVAKVKAVLPELTVKHSGRNSVPDGWETFDKAGVFIEGEIRSKPLKIWLLPKDWIGIRTEDATKHHTVYWEGVLEGVFEGERYKTITDCDDEAVHQAISKDLKMYAESLLNGDRKNPTNVFKDRFDEVDKTAQHLIDKFCKDQQGRNSAALSLILLGAPAKSVIMQCALNGSGREQEYCVSAVGYFGGKDVVQTLCKVMLDPNAGHECPKNAAMRLARICDPDSGPALEEVVEKCAYIEAATQAAAALERIGRVESAPKIFERMMRDEHKGYQSEFARPLATMRYQKAVPEIEKLCKTKPLTVTWALGMHSSDEPEISLVRLTGTWGQPGDGVRLLFLPPEKPIFGKSMPAVVLIENASKKDLDVIPFYYGAIIVDGTKHQLPEGAWDGQSNLDIGDVWFRPIDLDEMIKTPGKHEIQYQVGNAKSNVLSIEVSAEKDR